MVAVSSIPSLEQQCRKRVEDYLSTQKLDFEEDSLVWGKTASLKYPILSNLARKYLCVCATSSPSEQVYSTSGSIVTPLRVSMNPQKVDLSHLCQKNLQ